MNQVTHYWDLLSEIVSVLVWEVEMYNRIHGQRRRLEASNGMFQLWHLSCHPSLSDCLALCKLLASPWEGHSILCRDDIHDEVWLISWPLP